MDFTTEAERQAHQAARTKIYNDLQMVLGGNPLLPAFEALCDCLAVTAAMAARGDRAEAHKLLDAILPDLKRTADNNLDRVMEQQLSAGNLGMGSVGNS